MSDQPSDRQVGRIDEESRNFPSTKTFYETVFGWTFTEQGPACPSLRGGGFAGGLRPSGAMPEGGPRVVIYTRNLEALKARVASSGGKIVKEIFPIPGGRRFHFTDPGGNVLAVWSDR